MSIENNSQDWINYTRVYSEDLLNVNTLPIHEFNSSIDDEEINMLLLPHQKRTVKAMIDLENKRYVTIDFNSPDGIKFINPILETTAGVNSEKPGSGKTHEMLALILANTKLQNVAEITSLPFPKSKQIGGRYSRLIKKDNYFITEIRKTYKHVFKQTLIFVNKSVTGQWLEKINKLTKLRVFVISDVYTLRKFYSIVFKPAINDYDVILINIFKVTADFNVPELIGSSITKLKVKPILCIFGELFKNACWNRIIFDDFDTISIPNNSIIIPALFTWFVSATQKPMHNKNIVNNFLTTEDILRNYKPTYNNVLSNKELFSFCNVGCDDEFINQSTNANKIKYHLYQFKNINDNFIYMIGSMGEINQSIAEMLNGDAIKTAAKEAGVKTNNVADIFEKILDKSWKVYKYNVCVEKYIVDVKKYIIDLPNLNNNDDKLTQSLQDSLVKNIKNPGPLSTAKTILQFNDPCVINIIDDINRDNNEDKITNGKAIQRVKDNLKDGDCPITCESLADSKGVIVLKCCGVAISHEAGELLFTNTKSYVTPTCPKCRANIDASMIIKIDRSIDFNQILNDNFDLPEENHKDVSNKNDLDNIDDMLDKMEISEKLKCVIKIIQGKDDELATIKSTRNDISIPHLLTGHVDLGDAPNNIKKILIYANYKETTDALENALNLAKIKYAKVLGTTSVIKNICAKYHLSNGDDDAVNVLLISGPNFCAGLDLQNTTDLIFLHKIVDKNIELQIAGRGARYGRTNNFNIHYILYDNEVRYMFDNNNHN